MDSIRVSKVEKVLCGKSGSAQYGSLHLTAHHLIFRYEDAEKEEMWVPYPLISLVLKLPQTLHGQSPLTFHTRMFETFSLSFEKERDTIDVFESVKELTVCTSVNQLYAFFYTPSPPFNATGGWSIYSPREEFGRMGVGTRTKAWRFTDINKDHTFSPTYPSRLVVPTRISDSTLRYASKYRSKCRIPALTYLHWANFGSITRSSQPMVGIKQNRSLQDEKLVEAVFQSHHFSESRPSGGAVYGATSTNLIVDARPTANAVANTAKGAGTEIMDHYKDAKKVYSGIDHIHTMRESLAKIVDVLREADNVAASVTGSLPGEAQQLIVVDRQALRRSGWLRHMSNILESTALIVRNIHINSSHVLIHCSDGWDRTSQLSALAQLCLDPYYRTIRGFQILIEKDWVSFGHKFLDRCGHLSSDKFFTSLPETGGTNSGADAAQAFLVSVQNRFTSQSHLKETSPCFHQFLECVRQLQRQYPSRFEFNERFLRQLLYHLYSCQFGTFLYNCERERRAGEDGAVPSERTACIWDFFNSTTELELNKNDAYDPSLDEPSSRDPSADMGVLYPNAKDIRFWHELYGRTEEEMNGRIVISQTKEGPEFTSPIDSIEDDPINSISVPAGIPLPPSPARTPNLSNPSAVPSNVANASETLTAGLRGLWSSLPDIPQRVTGDNIAAPSPSSLRPSGPPLRPSSPGSISSSLGRTRTANSADMFSNTGVRSVWGKLSSNATAAFSAMQDVYDGVAKDLKTLPRPSGDNEEIPGKTSELQPRERLGDGERSTYRGTSQAYPAGSSYNPWDSMKPPKAIQVLPSDNPWSTTRSRSPRQISLSGDLFDGKSLPLDPTVAHPPRHSSSESHISGQDHNIGVPYPTVVSDESPVLEHEDKQSSTNTDPLGVGFL
ncbi:phosphatases II [Suillus paluster]|uniref:phosphatases II n=1 Tax=Suillus paluster TaxID=48578 RepID=UPI001B874ABA|nr:phosphatases II [Suillus paluster]KAG1756401.1 phosphatases II [Suillus paluster]